jgi:hypothetical protein
VPDSDDDLALRRIAGHNHRAVIATGTEPLSAVEAQSAGLFAGAVAFLAVFDE